MSSRSYILTATAENDLRLAKAWSRSRWNKDLTKQYFTDLHKGAEYIAQNHQSLRDRNELTGETGLSIYPVREHYIVYLPVNDNKIIIVTFIRQMRDVPAILAQESFRINREVGEIKHKIETGEIRF